LHDWEDEDSIRILRTIRAAAPPASRLFVVERVVGRPNEGLGARISDLHMLVMPGGRERTEGEWRSLLGRGGFVLDEIRPTASTHSVLVATPAP
ncbi:MAG TPA: methyltransferase, partial [Candidatus Limnocylindrales bacterium]|nr:methyltransferase [Candidatus Limnocylindrales bacterium]